MRVSGVNTTASVARLLRGSTPCENAAGTAARCGPVVRDATALELPRRARPGGPPLRARRGARMVVADCRYRVNSALAETRSAPAVDDSGESRAGRATGVARVSKIVRS